MYLPIQEQYAFIHDAILESVTCGDTQIGASNLRMAIQKLHKRNPQTGKTGFESQFHVSGVDSKVVNQFLQL